MLRGREVRPPQAYGDFYAVRLSGGRYAVRLYAPGNRRDPDIYVSTQATPEATALELRTLREGCEL